MDPEILSAESQRSWSCGPICICRAASTASPGSRSRLLIRIPLISLRRRSCVFITLVYFVASFSLFNRFTTTSTTRLKPSISSSTVPPMPALAKLIELLTYIGLPVLRANNLDSRVVKSRVALCVNRGVLSGWLGVVLYTGSSAQLRELILRD